MDAHTLKSVSVSLSLHPIHSISLENSDQGSESRNGRTGRTQVGMAESAEAAVVQLWKERGDRNWVRSPLCDWEPGTVQNQDVHRKK